MATMAAPIANPSRPTGNSIPNSNNLSNNIALGGTINGAGTMGNVTPLIPGTSNTANVGVTGSQDGSGLLSTLQGSGAIHPILNNPNRSIGNPDIPLTNTTSTTVPTTSSTTGAVDNTLAGQTSQQQQELDKQLVDIYGKGTGNLLDSLIGNLGSNDSAYLQSYENAMAPANAENLATLDTTLGNQGVSANSSAAAIANADFEKGVTSQESNVEQQLVNQDTQDELGLVQGLEGASQAEVSYNGLYNFLGQLAGDAGSIIGNPGGSASNTLGDFNSSVAQGNSDVAGLSTTTPEQTSIIGDSSGIAATGIESGIFL